MVALLKRPTHLKLPQGLDANLGAERRIFPRKRLRSLVEGRRVDHSIEAQRHPRLSLSVCDVSLGGMSALADVPLLIGERLSISFPPAGMRRGWHAAGRVLRCQPSGMGYRIAVEFDPLPPAA